MAAVDPTKAPPPPRDFSVYQLWAWILLIWSLYRFFVTGMPEWADEFIFKPLVFVVPVVWYVIKKEKRTLETVGVTGKNFFTALYVGLGFGMIFAIEGLFANYIKYGDLNIDPIGAFKQYGFLLLLFSLATAFSEELLSRGFVFRRIYEQTKNLPFSAFLSAIMFVLLHVPILVSTHKFYGLTLILFFSTEFVLGLANGIVFFYTGSLVAPMLVHLFWNMTVALYL